MTEYFKMLSDVELLGVSVMSREWDIARSIMQRIEPELKQDYMKRPAPYGSSLNPSALRARHAFEVLSQLKKYTTGLSPQTPHTVQFANALNVFQVAASSIISREDFSKAQVSFSGLHFLLENALAHEKHCSLNKDALDLFRPWWPNSDLFQDIDKLASTHSFQRNFETVRELSVCLEVLKSAKRAFSELHFVGSLSEGFEEFLVNNTVFEKDGSNTKDMFNLWMEATQTQVTTALLKNLYLRLQHQAANLVLTSCSTPKFTVKGHFSLKLLPWVSEYTLILPHITLRHLRISNASAGVENHSVLPFSLINEPAVLHTAQRLFKDQFGSFAKYVDIARRVG